MKQNIERISAGLTRLLDEVDAMLKTAAATAGEKPDPDDVHARARLHRVYEHLCNARSEVVKRVHRIDSTVHARPWRALAITAAVSFVMGLLVRRR